MLVTTDPFAWFLPYYEQLAEHPAFTQSAAPHRFDRLVSVVQADHPRKAAVLRRWDVPAQRALLRHLAELTSGRKRRREAIRLWDATKGSRTLTCLLEVLPTGVDVQLLEGGDFRRMQVVNDLTDGRRLAAEWRMALVKRRWTPFAR